MAVQIRSVEELRAYFLRVDRTLEKWQRISLERAITDLIDYARSPEAISGTFTPRTGNLQRSVGVLGLIRAPRPPRALPIWRTPPAALVRRHERGWTIFFGIAMEYARWVVFRRGVEKPWLRRVKRAIGPILRARWAEGQREAARELAS